MRPVRHTRCRRRQRPVRLVDVARLALPALGHEEASAYHVGLRAAELLKQHFPDFYAGHVVQLPASLPRLLGCMSAFFQLVEGAGFPLRPINDMYGNCYDTLPRESLPEETLTVFSDVGIEWMESLGYWLFTPRPQYYGLGVQSVLDDTTHLPGTLTVTLWHLFAQTPYSIGARLSFEQLADEIGDDVLHRINRLKPLPSDTPIHTLALYLDLPEVRGLESHQLLEYAFGRTDNDLANYTDYEVEAINMGETDEIWDWSNLPRLIALSREAQLLEATYDAWSTRVSADPHHEIPRVAGAIHRAARAAERELAQSTKSLIALLHGKEAARDYVEALNAL